jgi:hypothetical protein
VKRDALAEKMKGLFDALPVEYLEQYVATIGPQIEGVAKLQREERERGSADGSGGGSDDDAATDPFLREPNAGGPTAEDTERDEI